MIYGSLNQGHRDIVSEKLLQYKEERVIYHSKSKWKTALRVTVPLLENFREQRNI